MSVEHFNFVTGSHSNLTSKDLIIITDDLKKRTSHQLAFSRGMARGLQVDQVEADTRVLLDKIRELPKCLSDNDLPSRRSISFLTAELLQLRLKINLFSDLLESTPDVFWEDAELEKLFKAMIRTLEVPHRLEIVNTRLTYAGQILDLIREQLNLGKSYNIEMLIIILIVIEIIVECSWFL